MEQALEDLKARLLVVNDLHSAAALLRWDQSTHMPPGGAAARGRQMATLGRLAHERLTDPEVGRLLDRLEADLANSAHDGVDASLVRVTRRDFDRATKIPAAFMAEMRRHGAASYEAWTRARPANDYAAVEGMLAQTLDYSRRLADYFPGYDHPADPLIDFADHGMTVALLRPVFAQLRQELVPLLDKIRAAGDVDDSILRRPYPEDRQLALGDEIIRQLGYDFERGRVDKTPHPFMTKFSLGDVRITTRVREDNLGDCLFAMIHEAGHALYEQGIDLPLEGTPLAGGTSSGVHESQSRLWENIVGRSRAFWDHFFPRLVDTFDGTIDAGEQDAFLRAINRVQPSLIRTDADEVTYNLHVMIRFDLELEMLEGNLTPSDLPAAWRERYEADLGVAPATDSDGVLQDVHWFAGRIGGAFQGYTLGNIMSAQFYAAAAAAAADLDGDIGRGDFTRLLEWLRANVHRHGRKFTAAEILQRATGQPLTIEPYMRYLWDKYGRLYGIQP